ncbi:hypothetical protein PROAA_1520001 [Candidatus Propionivibrio aalborgensis]|uniref:Uncharacterized protein n=1 Tax=Candidatus Propionivibrio aalborgensis TaxID=1860101 RepID=A0A1A8XJR2_9RHOO|nr:hypothetical protein PROAA_1520001 [Candidatus Propionivibrio aalborgensis]
MRLRVGAALNLTHRECPADPKLTQVLNLPRPKYPQMGGSSMVASAPLRSAFAVFC